MSHFANCSGFNENQITTLVALRGGTSAVATVVAIVLLIVTIARRAGLGKDKKLKVHLFVLFGVSITYLTVLSLGVVYHFLSDPSAGRWCAAFGFFDQILSVIQTALLFTATYPIIAHLLSGGPKESISGKKKWVLRGFIGTVIVLAALIVTFSFVPFITGSYGEVGVWCWIFSIDENCKVFLVGLMEQVFFWTVYHSFISLICILMVMTAVILLLRACLYKIRHFHKLEDSHHDYKHISSKYIFQLFILVPVFFDFGDFVLVAHIRQYSFTKWVVLAIAAPISGLAIPLSFLLYIKFGNAGSENNQGHTRVNPSLRVLQSRTELNQEYVTAVASRCNAHSAANLRAGIQECGSYEIINSHYTPSTPTSGFVSADDDASWVKEHDTGQLERQNLIESRRNRICLIQ